MTANQLAAISKLVRLELENDALKKAAKSSRAACQMILNASQIHGNYESKIQEFFYKTYHAAQAALDDIAACMSPEK